MSNKLNVCEIFHSIQGEGKYVGLNVIFLRLSGCSLGCSFCDTQYHKEGKEMSISEVVKAIKMFDPKHLVITGGEPLLQQKELVELIKQLEEYFIIIETNGTIVPLQQLFKLVNHWSVSPKLVSSGNDIDKRLNYDALETFSYVDSIFKFVISDLRDMNECLKIIEQVCLSEKDIYLMPEGATKEKQEENMEHIIQYCLDNNFNFSPRLHILLWDCKRGV